MDLMYLDNLDEFINDENKIVTYRWLSLTLNVSSNIAKQMLYHYLQKSKDSDEECKLTVTYLLSGLQFDEELKQDVHKVCVIQDDKLEKLKSTFKAIYSLHVYSLQKVQLKDLHSLYGIDYDKIKEDVFQSAQYSSISPSSPFRSNIESKREIRAPSPKKLSPKKNIVTSKADANVIFENKENKFKENTTFQKNTKENAAKNTSKKTTKGSLESMFANQAKKQEIKKPLEVKQEPNLKSSSKSISDGVKKKGSMDAFVSKGAKVKSPPEEIRRSPRKKQEEEMVIKEEIDLTDSGLSKKEVEKKSQLTPKKKGNNKITKSKKKSPVRECKRKSTSTDLKSTKRQRIMTLQDSSSEASSEEEEEVLIDSPMPSPPPKTLESDDDESPFPPTPKPDESAENKNLLNKRKKKKLLDKTFVDEKGFFVTEKKWEYVTDSDEENPFPSEKSISPSKATNITSPIKKESPRKNASSVKSSPQKKNERSPKKSSPQKKKNKKSPAKGKQSSITSFFKAKN